MKSVKNTLLILFILLGSIISEAQSDITFSSLAVPCNTNSVVVAQLGVNDTAAYSFSLVNGTGDDDNDSFIVVGSQLTLNKPLACEPRNVKVRIKATKISTGTVIEKALTMRIRETSFEIQQLSLTNPGAGVKEIVVVNNNTVWITTQSGEINRTVNSGATWNNVTIPNSGNTLGTLWATSPDSAWVTISPFGTLKTGVYATVDGGKNWAIQPTAYNGGGSPFPDNIYFFNSKQGFVLGDFNSPVSNTFEMYTTVDGGVNWKLVPEANIITPFDTLLDYGINTNRLFDAVGDSLFYISGRGRFYRSINKGFNWSSPVGFPPGSFGFLEFTNSRNGILGYNDKIYKTTNGGNTWELVIDSTQTQQIRTASIPGTNKILVANRSLRSTPILNGLLTVTGDLGLTEVDARLGNSFNNVLSVGVGKQNTFWVGQFSDQIIKYSELQSVILIKENGEEKQAGEDFVFSKTSIGNDQLKELEITNTGNASLLISNIELTGDYNLEGAIPTSINQNSSITLTIKFAPTGLGERTGVLTILSNSDIPVFTFNLFGEGEVEPEVYNVITPRKNGKHDFLNIKNITFFPKNKVSIFDRWGNKVFEKDGYDNAQIVFAGTSDNNKELPDGTYYYVIDKNNGDKPLHGFIYLRR